MALEDLVVQTTLRYLHILAGIIWIGHLYFFNLVNLPLIKLQLKKPFVVDMAEKATANISLKVLFWFRWGAMFTLIFGLLLMEAVRQGADLGMGEYFLDRGATGYLILLGVLMAVVMWFNVWFIIWPNQQKILSNNKTIAAGVAEEEKKRLAATNAPLVRNAVMASRVNTWLSLPMLFGMVFGAHGGIDTAADGSVDWASGMPAFAVLAAVVLIAVIYSKQKPTPAK